MLPPKLEALRGRLRNLRYGLLLVPGLLALALIAFGAALSTLEHRVGPRGFEVIFTGDAPAARSVLTVLGEGIATILGISISITIVALQLVSQQFSPRALRNFLADRVTQVTAGTFVGTFGYALVVLRVTRTASAGQHAFVPTASVSAAILLGLVSLAVLLVFFHHMARVVQVEEISADIAHETLAAVDALYPDPFGQNIEEDSGALLDKWSSEAEPRSLAPERPGFVQRINLDDLPSLLKANCTRVHVRVAPGDFVAPTGATADVWPVRDGDGVQRALRSAIVVGSSRDIEQDALYGVRQLADIAIKAISPAINDPSTAWTAIHYIKSIVERIADRALPAEVRRYHHSDGELVVIARRSPFDDYIDIGFVQVGRYAADDARVAGALLEALADIARAAAHAGARTRLAALVSAAAGIAQPALRAAETERDRDVISELAERVRLTAARAQRAA